MTNDAAYWLAWAQLPGIGPVLLKRLHHHFGSLAAAWQADPQELLAIEGIGAQLQSRVVQSRQRVDPQALLDQQQAQPERWWTPAHPDYPRLLFEIADPPPLLYYRGVVDEAEVRGQRSAIALVGTRSPSDYGRRWTRRLSAALARQGFTVVSGLADGIDTDAHESCLEAGGRTVAVMGTGVDVVYPYRNRSLYHQIAKHGLILSEYSPGTSANRAHFPQRNRIVAGLCRAVIVLEAPVRSGALITARLANEYGRDVYVLPGSLDNERALGCLGLINSGAQVILSEGHLLEMLGGMPSLDPVQPVQTELFAAPPPPDLEPGLQQVLAVITPEAAPFDLIVQQAALPPGTVSSALLQLELLGLVTQQPGMRYQRCG